MKDKKKLRPARRLPVYTEADNLTNALLEGRDLSEKEEETLEVITEVWAILLSHPAAIAVIKIMRRYEIKRSGAYKWIRKAEDFYGQIGEAKIQAERLKQKLRLEGIIFNPKVEAEVKLRAEKQLSEILGLRASEQAKRPRKRQIIRRTTNANVLKEEIITEE